MATIDLGVDDQHDTPRGQTSGPSLTRGRSLTSALIYGQFNQDTVREERLELKKDTAEKVDELLSLSSGARRARLRADLRHCVDGDASYVRRIHASAERRAQAQHARTRGSLQGARHYAPRVVSRERRTDGRKSVVAAGTSDDADPAAAWTPKSKFEQTVVLTNTRNERLGKGVWASTLPVRQTCPGTCPLLDSGCYAREIECRHPFGGHQSRVAYEEARLIRHAAQTVAPRTPLRLHSTGDSSTSEAAQTVSAACEDWPGPVWSFTHAWRDVRHEAWGRVSILAGMDRPEDAASAMKRGYAAALVVEEHPRNGQPWRDGGVEWIPCPSEIHEGVTCADCRLCFNADKLRREGKGIAFAAGSGAGRVRSALVQLRKKREGSR